MILRKYQLGFSWIWERRGNCHLAGEYIRAVDRAVEYIRVKGTTVDRLGIQYSKPLHYYSTAIVDEALGTIVLVSIPSPPEFLIYVHVYIAQEGGFQCRYAGMKLFNKVDEEVESPIPLIRNAT